MKRKDRPSIVQKISIFLFLLGAVASVLIVFSLVRDYSMGMFSSGAENLSNFAFDSRQDQELFYVMEISCSMGLMVGGLGLIIGDIRAYLKERRDQDKK